MNIKNKHIKSILITDVEGDDQTSAVTANFGIYFSRDLGKKVLVIDANLRTPSLAECLEIPDTPGLIDIIEGKSTIAQAVRNLSPNLDILPTRKADKSPIGLLDSSLMVSLMKKAEEEYDLVLVNCSVDVKNNADPALLASYTGAAIIVLYEGRDRSQGVKLAINALNGKDHDNVFVILNNRTINIPKFFYKVT